MNVAQVVKTWEQQTGRSDKTVDPAAASATACFGEAMWRTNAFVEAWHEAGNLALKLLPTTGGFYVAGGIAANLYSGKRKFLACY